MVCRFDDLKLSGRGVEGPSGARRR
jgi:hypothetical protein